MTDSDKIARLEQALKEPEGKYSHAEIRQRLQALQTHRPGEGNVQPEFVDAPPQAPGLGERVRALGRGVKSLGSMAVDEVKAGVTENPYTPDNLNPGSQKNQRREARRRQVVRGLDDAVALGYATRAADALHEMQGQGRPFAQTAESDQAMFPDERTGGGVVGSFLPGASSLAGRAGAGIAGKALGRVPVAGPLAGAGMGAAKGIAGYEAFAPVLSALHAESGGNRLGAAKEAAIDPLGLILAGTVGAVGGAGRGKANQIRDERTQSGRVLRDVREAGGPGAQINMFGEPVSGGIFESPEMRNLPIGRQGTHELADRGVSRIEGANQARLKAARAQFGDTVDEVIASHGGRPHPTTNSHLALDRMDAENTINGVIGDEGVARATDKVRRMLTQPGGVDEQATLANVIRKMRPAHRPRGQIAPNVAQQLISQAAPEDIVPGRIQQTSAGDMVKTRKLVRQLANDAATPSENRVYQVVLSAMDEDAAAIDPRIREMNANFSRAMQPIEQSNEIMFGKKGRDPELSEAQRTTGIGRMGRIGDDTQAGTVRDPAIQRFEQLGPEYAQEVQLMRAKKAQERLRRGEPGTSDAIEKTIQRGPPWAARAIGGLFGGPVGFMAGLGIDKYRQNPLANQVRIGLPASEAAGKLTGRSAVGVDQVSGIAARRGKKKRKQKEERAAP